MCLLISHQLKNNSDAITINTPRVVGKYLNDVLVRNSPLKFQDVTCAESLPLVSAQTLWAYVSQGRPETLKPYDYKKMENHRAVVIANGVLRIAEESDIKLGSLHEAISKIGKLAHTDDVDLGDWNGRYGIMSKETANLLKSELKPRRGAAQGMLATVPATVGGDGLYVVPSIELMEYMFSVSGWANVRFTIKDYTKIIEENRANVVYLDNVLSMSLTTLI